MTGLFKCPCGKQQWKEVDPIAATVQAPICCGVPMTFMWTFIVEKDGSGD